MKKFSTIIFYFLNDYNTRKMSKEGPITIRNNIFLPKKHISFAQNVITRVRVYTFRPTKNLWILLELGYLLTPNLPGTLTRKPVKFPEQVFQPSSGSPVSGLGFRAN